MQTIATDDSKQVINKKFSLGIFATKYLFNPTKSGMVGFSTFFMLLLVTKLISVFVGTSEYFSISIDDVLLSLIGFSLVFSIRILENFKGE